MVETIQRSGAALLTIINDILDFSKIEAGRLELAPEPTAMPALLDDVTTLLKGQATGKGVALRSFYDPELPITLLVDSGRFRQILLNLIGNALKFTASGEVMISLTGQPANTGVRLRCSVRDTGIGIPADKLASIFSAFTQAEASTTRRFGGTGLGLSITRSLVEAMGGTIGAESTVGEGSTFWFEVPLAAAKELPASAVNQTLVVHNNNTGNHDSTAVARPHVLIADDNPVNRLIASKMLARSNATCDLVTNGREAVTACRDNDYQLVLMDISMPEMDGLEATSAIRAWEQETGRARLPIVALTAHAMEGDRARFLAAGMDDYLEKPLQLARFLARLERWTSNATASGDPANHA